MTNLRSYKLHLKDPVSFFINKYIEDTVKLEIPELYEEIDEKISKIIYRINKSRLGEGWEKFFEKVPDDYTNNFIFPNKNIVKYCLDLGYDKIPSLNYDYHIKTKFIFSEDFYKGIKRAEKNIIVSLICKIVDYKYKTIKDLYHKDILDKYGRPLPGLTYGDVYKKVPLLISWWIENFLNQNSYYDKVTIITEKEDLEDLKRCIMI